MSKRVFFIGIGWMRCYRGPQPGDEKPEGGGRHTEEHVGDEAWNFLEHDGWLYGYGTAKSSMHLQRIDPAAKGASKLDDTTVIFCAVPPNTRGRVVVGWYRKSTVLRGKRQLKRGDGRQHSWWFKARPEEAWLLPPDERESRKWKVPSGPNSFGQSQHTYGRNRGGDLYPWAEEILIQVKTYNGANLYRERRLADAEERMLDACEVVEATRSGQGWGLSGRERKAVETCAMQAAIQHYKGQDYDCIDRSVGHPYDLECAKGPNVRFVEVKGTTGAPKAVFLSRGEVDHVWRHEGECDLFVWHGIDLVRHDDGPAARGGRACILAPLDLKRGDLSPICYEYRLPVEGRDALG